MYQRILVGVDGSETAERGLAEAIRLAKDQHAEIRLLHVADLVLATMDAPFAFEEMRQSLVRTGEEVLNKAAEAVRAAGVAVSPRMLEVATTGNRVGETLVDEAKAWPADLIVVGTHGRRGFSHLLLGSVAESVVRMAPCPVLLVRGEAPGA